MKTTGRRLPTPLAAALALTLAAADTVQDRPREGIAAPAGDTPGPPPQTAAGELILEREVFTYPARGRRNPFVPREAALHDSPGAERIRLLGIIHHPDPRYRIAVIGFDGGLGGTGDQEGGPAAVAASRFRVGEARAGVRIAAIEVDRVVVVVEEPGGPATRMLAIPRAGQGRES